MMATTFEQWDAISVITKLASGETVWAAMGERNMFGDTGIRQPDGTWEIADCTVLQVYGADDGEQLLEVRSPRGYVGSIWQRFARLEGRRVLQSAATLFSGSTVTR